MTLTRYKRTRFWAVYDAAGQLVCVTVYKKGARAVIARLLAAGLFAQ
jgi:YD repeat-containing protein